MFSNTTPYGSDGGQVVSVRAFYSVDLSSIPAKVYSFNSVNCLKRTKINKKFGSSSIGYCTAGLQFN